MSQMTTRDKVAIGPTTRTETEYVTGELAEQLRDFNNSLNLPDDQQLTGSMDIEGNPIYDLIDIVYWPVFKEWIGKYEVIQEVLQGAIGYDSNPAKDIVESILMDHKTIRKEVARDWKGDPFIGIEHL